MRVLRARKVTRLPPVALATVAALGIVAVGGPPDSEVNPQTGHIESVYVDPTGGSSDVKYTIDTGTGPGRAESLTAGGPDDLAPRLTIDGSGAAWVVWWRDGATDEVLYRRRDVATGEWTAAVTISAAGEDSSEPEIVLDGAEPWVAYRITGESGTGIAVNRGSDTAEPFPGRTILATTSYVGDIDLLIHEESGRLWLTWVDSDLDVAWTSYDNETDLWSATDHESYANDTVEDARGRIRAAILGG